MQEAEQQKLQGDDEVVNDGEVAGTATALEQQVADSDALVDGCCSNCAHCSTNLARCHQQVSLELHLTPSFSTAEVSSGQLMGMAYAMTSMADKQVCAGFA